MVQSAFYASDSTTFDVPAAQKVRERMTNRAVFDRIKSRLAQYKSTILQRTTVQPPHTYKINYYKVRADDFNPMTDDSATSVEAVS